MYEAHHPKGDINRVQLRRDQSPGGLIVVEEYVQIERNSLVEYLQGRIENLLEVDKKKQIMKRIIGEKVKIEIEREHVKQIEEKPLHAQIWRVIEDIFGTKAWNWLKKVGE